MLAKDIDFSKIKNESFERVVLGRRTARYLDPNYVVPRDEILQIVREALSFTPSAVNSQPYKFLIVDDEDSKAKLDSIMRATDIDRVKSSSFAITVLADRQWFDEYDELIERNRKITPDKYTDEYVNALIPEVYKWYEELSEDGGRYLDRSISFQAGLVTMSLCITVKAHGLDSGIMDNWAPELLADEFGIDLDRYVPQCVLACGKSTGPVFDCYRYEAEEMALFG